MGLGCDWVDACDEGFAANSGGPSTLALARLLAEIAPPPILTSLLKLQAHAFRAPQMDQRATTDGATIIGCACAPPVGVSPRHNDRAPLVSLCAYGA